MSANLPVLQSAKSPERFLNHIQSAGIPQRTVNSTYLKSVGFKSGNDAALIPAFKALGFIDSVGSPTERWRRYRDKTQAKEVLAEAIRDCYAGLFEIFPDAYRRDGEAIANWIRTETGFAGITVDRAVRTFKTLVSQASFSETETPAPERAVAPSPVPQQVAPALVSHFANTSAASVNINVELHLPATNDPQIYENFFKAMKEHLLGESK